MAMKQYQQLDAEIENAEDHQDDQSEKSMSYPSTCPIQTKRKNGM
jgi:hypothetical protein